MQHIGTRKRRVLIAGAGIAGPVLAMFLARAGFSTLVCEASAEPREGERSFISLSSDGIKVLRKLGILKQTLDTAFPSFATLYQNHRGRILGHVDQARLSVERSAMVRALRDTAVSRGTPIHYGKRLERLDLTPSRTVVATFTDGSALEADFLVGADGLHSDVRRLALPEAREPRPTGFIRSSGVAPNRMGIASGVLHVTFGHVGQFLHQATPKGEIYWCESFEALGDESPFTVTKPDWQQRLLKIHRADPTQILDLISSSVGPISRHSGFELESPPRWHTGPICLLGDAVHAGAPHYGQGAELAIEDALILAQCVRDHPSLKAAFSRFEAIQRPRAERRLREARRLTNLGAPAGALRRGVRDLLLPVLLKMGDQAA